MFPSMNMIAVSKGWDKNLEKVAEMLAVFSWLLENCVPVEKKEKTRVTVTEELPWFVNLSLDIGMS